MRPLAAERGTGLSTSSEMDRTDYVMADRQRFKQVLLNLLTNAVKYTPPGGAVTVSYRSAGPATTRILVEDNGAGISHEKLTRLFTPFDRLGAESTTIEGTGLGLALCQRLMHAMNGNIGADSVMGEGSAFWVELACAESPLARVASVKQTSSPFHDPVDVPTRTILYVEDNLSNLTLIEQILAEQTETRLITAMQGQLGIELARQHAPDVILLDLHLPDLPGWEVLSRLKRDDSTSDIPVVVISADATSRQIKRLMAAGASAYLTKPLDMQEFFRVIEETTARRGTEECAA
jgi:CheY-like chemotaxis protein/anti-sigma regulatory factor (Ser/Thr protein kinase)